MLRRLAGKLGFPVARVLREMRQISGRERAYLSGEIAQFRGFMPLLARTGARKSLSSPERAELHAHLRRASNLSPYLVATLLPGAFVLLPVLLWWRDRRRNRDAHKVACTPGKVAS